MTRVMYLGSIAEAPRDALPGDRLRDVDDGREFEFDGERWPLATTPWPTVFRSFEEPVGMIEGDIWERCSDSCRKFRSHPERRP